MPHAELRNHASYPGYVYTDAPRNVYWEMTIACPLACKHCRANAIHERDPLELSFAEARGLIRDIKSMGLIGFSREIGVPTSITPSTTPTVTRDAVRQFKQLGIAAMGVSLDGPNAAVHDAFRGVDGTFEHSQDALQWAREFHIPVQINTTVTTETLPHLPAMFELLQTAAPPVRRWSLFLLVPVGRGTELGIPTAHEVEELFQWVYDAAKDAPFHVGTVEAPHYRRFWAQRKLEEGLPVEQLASVGKRMGFGMRDGNGVIFVSHRGEVYPAGFLPYPLLGNVRERPLSEIYRDTPSLHDLRNMDALKGKCGVCEFRWACGGSRARAYSMTGDPMGSDPFCEYEPAVTPSNAR